MKYLLYLLPLAADAQLAADTLQQQVKIDPDAIILSKPINNWNRSIYHDPNYVDIIICPCDITANKCDPNCSFIF
jgi:hypothetical protein